MKGSTEAHQRLVDDLLYAFGSMPNVRVWIRVVGFDRESMVKYGIKGEADIQGIIAPSGRMLAIEVKSGNATLSAEQKRWRAMIEKFGAVYVEARSVSQALDDFKKQI